MASQQGRLLHDGIVMAIVRVGIPAGQDGLMLITEQRDTSVKEEGVICGRIRKDVFPTLVRRWQQLTFRWGTKGGDRSLEESNEGGQGS